VKIVVDLQDQRAVWQMPPWVPDRLRAALPSGADLVLVDQPADGSGDGATELTPLVLEAIRDADAYLGFGILPAILTNGPKVRWVHSGAAGVASSLTPEMLASPVLFTNSAGVHGPAMAETVVAMILHFARGLDIAVRAQANAEWSSERFYESKVPFVEVSRSTVGIVGYGGIGREVAKRVRALGARVLAVRRGKGRPGASAEIGDSTRSVAFRPDRATPEVDGAKILAGSDGLATLLRDSDYVVLAAPLTPETKGMIGARELETMKPTAVLVNVSRGPLVDQEALTEALANARLRGAALDVFAKEPLAADHPLWSLANVLITPHVSAVTDAFWEREAELITDNFRRFAAGEPLRNLVDKEAGY
jgi:phosphoglycerate dehydrogenase-like enzyme